MNSEELNDRAKEIIQLAAQGLPLEGNYRMPDELLYYRAKELYDLHAKGMITAIIGAERKQTILHEYFDDCKRDQMHADYNRQTAELFKGIEAAFTDYMQDRTLENADNLCYAIHHVRPNIGGKNAR